MKKIVSIIAFLSVTFLVADTWASEVHATVKQEGGNTIVYCSPEGIRGEISKANITIYESDGHRISVIRGRMDISTDNVATYILPGTHLEVAGKCKLFTSHRNEIPTANPGSDIRDGIARADFYLSMK